MIWVDFEILGGFQVDFGLILIFFMLQNANGLILRIKSKLQNAIGLIFGRFWVDSEDKVKTPECDRVDFGLIQKLSRKSSTNLRPRISVPIQT